jgi:hypothetical protein
MVGSINPEARYRVKGIGGKFTVRVTIAIHGREVAIIPGLPTAPIGDRVAPPLQGVASTPLRFIGCCASANAGRMSGQAGVEVWVGR